MSKNTLLSALINYVSANSSGNVVIAAPSSGYALDVTGTGRFTGNLTVSSPELIISTASGNGARMKLISTSANGREYQIGSNYVTGNGEFAIYDATASASRLTITSAGNVGIGTSSPTDYGTGSAGKNLQVTGSGYGILTANAGSVFAWIIADTAEAATGTQSNHPFKITTNNVARVRFTADGFTKISNDATYANAGSYHELRTSNTGNWTTVITNKSTVPYGILINYPTVAPNVTGDNQFMICSDSANDKFIIWSSGSVVNRTGSYGVISDVKFKENVVDATPKLSDLMNLKVRNYNLIGDSTKQIGFIAQELEEVFPGMIEEAIERKEGGEFGESYKSIKTSVLIPMLVKAIQELKAELDLLKQQ